MPSLGQVFIFLVAILVQFPVYILVKIHMANDMTHETIHPWYQWAKFLFWYFIYHDAILLISYAYTTEANVISCLLAWLFGCIEVSMTRIFGLKSKKRKRKNRRRRRKTQGFYSEYDDFDQEEYEYQYRKEFQEEEAACDNVTGDQGKCDKLLQKLLDLVPGMMTGQATHYEKLVEQFKGKNSQ